jgi:hypothetical protein
MICTKRLMGQLAVAKTQPNKVILGCRQPASGVSSRSGQNVSRDVLIVWVGIVRRTPTRAIAGSSVPLIDDLPLLFEIETSPWGAQRTRKYIGHADKTLATPGEPRPSRDVPDQGDDLHPHPSAAGDAGVAKAHYPAVVAPQCFGHFAAPAETHSLLRSSLGLGGRAGLRRAIVRAPVRLAWVVWGDGQGLCVVHGR